MLKDMNIFGILNITPDSFSDGGVFLDDKKAFQHIEKMILEGADGIDIGAESSRPGADSISVSEELRRLKPVIKQFKKYFDIKLSVDTTKSQVAEFSLNHGADMINDISACQDDAQMSSVLAQFQAPVILMHRQGTVKTMQDNPFYKDVVEELIVFFKNRLSDLLQKGLSSFILDPGIGFGKSLNHNLSLMKHLDQFVNLGYPVMLGSSRKSFISDVLNANVNQRLGGSLASCLRAFQAGVSYFRVHDVYETRQCLSVYNAILKAN